MGVGIWLLCGRWTFFGEGVAGGISVGMEMGCRIFGSREGFV